MQLFLNSYGTYLHVKDALFEVRVPASGGSKKHHFAASKVTSIIITTSAALSTDAVQLALMNNIDIVFSDRSGFPIGRVWHSKLGSTTRIRKRQLEASLGPEAVYWTLGWVGRKLENQTEWLARLKKHRAKHQALLDEKISQIRTLRESLSLQTAAQHIGEIAETVRGLEGTAGRLYFETLSLLLMKEYQFEGRSFRPARDPFNAFLNYGYGVLYSRVEKALMIAGLDPYVGFLHRDDYNQKSMVFDFIEPYRIWVDEVVFRLFSAKKVNRGHTHSLTQGVSLEKEGKQLLIERLNEFIDVDRIRYKGRNQTRMNAMQMDAHRFANSLLEKE